MMRILIIDDHPVVRSGIKHILEKDNIQAYIGEAENAQAGLELIENKSWNIIILDINLPGQNGLDLLRELHLKYPYLPILILSIYSEDQYALRVLKEGASGYLNKQSSPCELIEAINKIIKGGKYISERTAELLVSRLENYREKTIQEILSDREFQIFILIATGQTISEIAQYLSLSIKTVSTYQARILKKMNFKNKIGLTHYAILNGLIE